jgi:hypothetical protein
MFNFSRLMVKSTKRRVPMLTLGVMQLIGAVGTEIVNITLICQQTNAQDIIMNFIALGVIAEIDDIYANTLYNNTFKNRIEENEYKLII